MKKEDRNIYISNMDVDEARETYFSKVSHISSTEEISVLDALGRMTYEAIYARTSSPYYNAAAMDGILVKAETTYGASEVSPKVLKEHEDFAYINTGGIVKGHYDAVIMIEDVIEMEEGRVKIIKAAHPWQHIRPIGEDIVATEMIIPSRHKVRPMDLGALMAGGITNLLVYKKPKVAIIPTGSEIIEDIKDLDTGKIIDSNSRVFQGLVIQYGGEANRYSPVKDEYELLRDTIMGAVENNDIILVNAGSSAGSKDFTSKIINELGQVMVHGVALKPGKPTILGVIKGKPVIGIPGYPVSSYVVFETFVKPLIYLYTGQRIEKEETIHATITKRKVSSLKNKELIRVNLGYVNDKFVATPLSSGAGVTMSLVKADGIVVIPQNSEGVEAGEEVEVRLFKSITSIKETLVSIGSHDLIMDIIADMMPLSSAHVGSMGGIMAMRRGECHMAPIHLLDHDTGYYNIPYIKKYFKNKKMICIKGLKREQGLMVKKGNPIKIMGIKDLVRKDVQFVNRQRGAGTRILLDYKLRELGIDSQDIIGYEREMTTHMAVAMAVKTGSATTGLGIKSAAKAMDLDFIEIGHEDYDFILPYNYLEDHRVTEFISVLRSQEFKKRVMALGGYKVEDIGNVEIIE